jgi:hypothetical protein
MFSRSKEAYLYGSKHPKFVEKSDGKENIKALTKMEEA